MNIHEYQAKALLRDYGLPILKGQPAFSVDEAVAAAEQLAGPVWVVKAQIHAGGRGKAGGVKVVRSVDDVRKAADALLGSTLVTHQTGPQGKEVHRLYIEDGCAIADEFYLSLLVDRKSGWIVVIASKEGGVDIEEVAATAPEKIVTVRIDPATGLMPFHARRVASALGLKSDTAKQAEKAVAGLYKAFTELDAGLVEINPLVVTEVGDVVLLDAKLSFDNNALFRHREVAELRDKSEEDPTEVKAKEYDLSYIKLDGNIGCMVNGAGLAMATMDLIKLKGAAPANFLDVGGGATREKVTAALKIILSDEHVEGILVNIFGGIMRCDIIAQGIVEAARDVDIHVPLVVRLEGTKVSEGKEILESSGLPIISADDLDDAADKVVAAIAGKA